MNRLIFHIDVNSAFLSWEATRRVQQGLSDLRTIPSIIGGDPGRRTSIVLAKSIPAKKYGIVTGEPVSAAVRKCPDVVVAPSDFGLYAKMSGAFKSLCKTYTPVMEEFSIDECFLDMTGMEKIYPDPVKTAEEIKDRIKEELGFTVNVGIGPNKLLAKMASDFEKPDKVHTLFKEEIPRKMWTLPVNELFLCGKASADKLKGAQITTIGDLAQADVKLVKAIIGNKAGTQLWQYANGIDESPVKGEAEAPKGYSNELTFDENIISWDKGENVLLHLADNVSARVRHDKVKAFCIAVTIRGNDMKKHSHQQKLSYSTDSSHKVYEIAKGLFRELWDGKKAIRLIGLAMTDIDRGEGQYTQLSMFDAGEEDDRKERDADRAMDQLRDKFGRDIIKRGGMMKREINFKKRK